MSNPSATRYFRIGEIAARTGLSSKALRLYEQRGLLRPCAHSAAGYRLYGAVALQRLMRIVLLKRSGFSLAEIGVLLQRDGDAALAVIAARVDVLEAEVAQRRQALSTLRMALQRAGSTSSLTLDDLMESIAMSHTLKVDLTPVEKAKMRERAEALGPHAIEAGQKAWPALIDSVRAAMRAGTPPADPAAIELGRRWHALVNAATGNDDALNQKIGAAWQANPEAMAAQGMDIDMFRYIGAAMAAAGLNPQR